MNFCYNLNFLFDSIEEIADTLVTNIPKLA